MEFWTDKKNKVPSNEDQNYIWEYEPGEWAIVMNQDKVSDKKGKRKGNQAVFKLSDEIQGVTNGKLLNQIINESIKQLPLKPRYNFVFLQKNSGQMSAGGFDNLFKQMFKPKKLATNMFRKIYINYWFRQDLNPKQLRAISERMRHSQNTARDKYFKTNWPFVNVVKPIKNYAGLPDDPGPRNVPRPEPKTSYFDPKEYAKKYRERNKEKLKVKRKENYDKNKHKILRNKILFMLNVAQTVKKPRKATIDKYDLKYDKTQKKWI